MTESKHSFRALLRSRHIVIAMMLTSILLAASSVTLGYRMDDFIQRVYVMGSEPLHERGLQTAEGNWGFWRTTLHYFTFFNPKEVGQIQSMKEYGNVPWWFFEEAQLSFFRPLTSMTHWVDFQLWPDQPGLMHFHSVLWAAFMIGVITLIYRRFLGPTAVAGFAALLYVLDLSRLEPATWIANRNALLATGFGLLCLYFHDQWRQSGKRQALWLSLLSITIAVLSAEAGVGVLAFLLAYALCIDSGTIKSRALSLAPVFTVIIVYRLIYRVLGYGALHTRMYIDPIKDPIEFISAVIERAPVLLTGHFTGIDAINTAMSISAQHKYVLFCYAFLALVAFILWPILKRDKVARFWLTSMLISVIPVCAYGVQQGRLLTFAAVAGMGLVALCVQQLIRKEHSVYPKWFRIPGYVLVGYVALAHMILPVVVWVAMSSLIVASGGGSEGPALQLQIGTDEALANETVVVVNPPDPFRFVYLPYMRDHSGEPIPKNMRILATGSSDMKVTRVDEYSLKIRPDAGFLPNSMMPLKGAPENLPAMHMGHTVHKISQGYHDERNPMYVGEQYKVSDMTVTVTELTDDQLAAEALFTFNKPLEATHYRWLYWQWPPLDAANDKLVDANKGYLKYHSFPLPAIGESVTLRGPFWYENNPVEK